jgi:undecaprenyl diphosphate synthase
MPKNIDVKPPRHVGFIVDGNRRWAKARGLLPYKGHAKGYDILKEIVFEAVEGGVEFISLYIFSTENWKRSEFEVNKLMSLAMRVFKNDLHEFIEKGIRIRVLGSRDRLSGNLIKAIDESEEKTKYLQQGTACICFNYGGRDEIVEATKKIISSGIQPNSLNEQEFANYLYHPEVPSLDLIVRTSGEQRLSNFMLWRAAYAELMFIEKNWPDMKRSDVYEIIKTYKKRIRRMGR